MKIKYQNVNINKTIKIKVNKATYQVVDRINQYHANQIEQNLRHDKQSKG